MSADEQTGKQSSCNTSRTAHLQEVRSELYDPEEFAVLGHSSLGVVLGIPDRIRGRDDGQVTPHQALRAGGRKMCATPSDT